MYSVPFVHVVVMDDSSHRRKHKALRFATVAATAPTTAQLLLFITMMKAIEYATMRATAICMRQDSTHRESKECTRFLHPSRCL